MNQKNVHHRLVLLTCLAVVGLCVTLAAATSADDPTDETKRGQKAAGTTADLTELSLEELMNIEVTLASRRPQRIQDTASAVYVLTEEDIKRSGATNIPEALRLVPGLEVAHIDASDWAISCRGFNGLFANKLLVLIDGRSVYTPLFAGVYWDVQDVVIEDVDRIEVVRGPGATMWGANAVNGVINIITKPAGETQGTLVAETLGSAVRNTSVVRHGGKMGKSGHFRIFGKYFNRGPFVDTSGNDANDKWRLAHGGFRADWDASDRDQMTLQGDIYSGDEHVISVSPSMSPPYQRAIDIKPHVTGWNLLGKWTRVCSDTTDMALQVYFDQTSRDRVTDAYTLNTFDVDFQQHSALSRRHDVVWGLGYRLLADDTRNTFYNALFPPSRTLNLFSAFAQDQMTLVPDRLVLALGSKFEHNDYTGFEIQPSARLLWTPNPRHALWGAVSRAVRTPSRAEEDVRINLSVFPDPQDPNLLYLASIFGSPGLHSDELIAYELGYRTQASDRLFLDLAGFYNVYHRIGTADPGTPFPELSPPPPHVVIPFYAGNNMHGHSYGFEASANWHPRSRWRVVAGYSHLGFDLTHTKGIQGSLSNYSNGVDPRNQFFLRSSIDLPGNMEFDSIFRYVDKLPAFKVPSYVELDLRLAWQPKEDIEVALVGQNLLHGRHPEFSPFTILSMPTEVPRSVYGKVTWRF